MTWFKVDDKAHDHKKFRDPNLPAIGFWTLAGSWSGDNKTDGFVPESLIRRWGATKTQTAWLVDRGLFKPAEVDGEHGWIFHDWDEWQPLKEDTDDALGRARAARKRALSRNRDVLDLVAARDGGLCRYCGIAVNFKDRRGPRGGTYDHIDPTILDTPRFPLANSPDNVVIACRRCNGRKGARTPEEARMPLLPPGTTVSEVRIRLRSESASTPTQSHIGSTPKDGGATAQGGTESGRSQVGAENGSGHAGSGRIGTGQAPDESKGADK